MVSPQIKKSPSSEVPEHPLAPPDLSTLQLKDLEKSTDPINPTPPHRSHDPRDNLKRSDPFQFGSRYLEEGDDVYEFNAWDHVETDENYKEYAEVQYAKQRESPVSEFDKRTSLPRYYMILD